MSRRRPRFTDASEVPIGGLCEALISNRWCPVLVLGRRAPGGAVGGRFDIRRFPYKGNSLNPRDWMDLRPMIPRGPADPEQAATSATERS